MSTSCKMTVYVRLPAVLELMLFSLLCTLASLLSEKHSEDAGRIGGVWSNIVDLQCNIKAQMTNVCLFSEVERLAYGVWTA